MGWIPDKPSDAIWFVVAPITTGPTFVYSAAGYTTGDYPLGEPDWRASIRNSVLWAGAAGSVYGWNLMMSPQNATWVSGSTAYKTLGHMGGLPLAALVATAAVGAAYVATADVHGGAYGGSMGVGPYQGSSDPMGDFRTGVENFFGYFGL